MQTLADKIIAYNEQLEYNGALPDGIRIMNPFKTEAVRNYSQLFYKKYYDEIRPRQWILGINPGRFGGGITGIPFTDPKRLADVCGIPYTGEKAHEPSSVFIYEVIDAMGGPEAFYQQFYINSICPLGFTKVTPAGKEINYNYYDSKALTAAVYDFIVENLQKQAALGLRTDVVFCLGTGQNHAFLEKLNQKWHFFGKIVPLDHPRFVMQYRAKRKAEYVQKYQDWLMGA
ncbi:MAG: DUF4918 family protein [Bacteroidetes bacterium]|nr:DUF4918 family protein [Bacteroidota bacterium]